MTVEKPTLARHFWGTFLYCAWKNPLALGFLTMNVATYLHLGPFSRDVIREIDGQIAAIDSGTWPEPELMPVPVEAEAARPFKAPKRAATAAA